MSEPQPQPSNDSLGLDLDSLKVNDDDAKDASAQRPAAEEKDSAAASPAVSTADAAQPTTGGPEQSGMGDEKRQPQRERKKPYINPERVKTGGAQRVCSGPG